MRVVSLLPAATEIVAALGAGSALIGVSHECDYPPDVVRGLPRVTSTTIDAALPSGVIDRQVAAAHRAGVPTIRLERELLRQLAPDILIGQAVCDVCAVGPGELAGAAAALVPSPRVVTLHAHSLDSVFDDMLRVGDALDLRGEAEELVAGLRYRLRRLAAPRAGPSRHRVLVLEWLDPPYVAGHWVPELVAIAGGVDVGGRAGERSAIRPWADLRSIAPTPEVVLIALCGFDIPRARREFAAVTDPDARALFGTRVEFLDGNAYTSRPGPRLVDAAALIAGLIGG